MKTYTSRHFWGKMSDLLVLQSFVPKFDMIKERIEQKISVLCPTRRPQQTSLQIFIYLKMRWFSPSDPSMSVSSIPEGAILTRFRVFHFQLSFSFWTMLGLLRDNLIASALMKTDDLHKYQIWGFLHFRRFMFFCIISSKSSNNLLNISEKNSFTH